MKKAVVAGLCIVVALSTALAESLCRKPYLTWTRAEAHKLLNDSPWSKKMALGRSVMAVETLGDYGADSSGRSPRSVIDGQRDYGADKRSGVSGEKERYDAYLVRLFSALPVRQAFVRMYQLMNDYDSMTRPEKIAFNSKFGRALMLDVSDDIVVTVEFFTNNPPLAMEVDRQLKQANFETLKQSAYLIGDHSGRIPLKAYFAPSTDGTGAKLVFPRTLNGAPVISAEDKEIKFEFFPPGSGHKVYIVWKVKDLVCDGQVLF